MRKISYIVLFTSAGLTALLVILWILGFLFGSQAVGGLIHLLLVLAMLTFLGVVVGTILLIVSIVKK